MKWYEQKKNCVPNLSEIIRKVELSLRNAYCLILNRKQSKKTRTQIAVKSSLLMFSETWDWS